MNLSQMEFDQLRGYIYDICGLAIHEEKKYLVQQRLESLVLGANCQSFQEYHWKIVNDPPPNIKETIINAITTNETSFFRDSHPFINFSEYILPELGKLIRSRKERGTQRKGPKARIWCAASSTGEEPYTIAILINEFVQANSYLGFTLEDFGLIASDISTKVLAKGIAGEYTEMQIKRGLSTKYRDKYFHQVGQKWCVKDYIRSMVEFRQINLVNNFSMLGGFDIIFCRNVLIYFDEKTKIHILTQFHQLLSEKGLLILGSTENINGMPEKFESVNYGGSLFYTKTK